RVAERRGVECVTLDHEEVLARALAHEAVHVERDAFDVAIRNRFHLDELRGHVIRACLGHRRHGVRGVARPGGDADVHTLLGIAVPEVLTPLVVGDVDLDRHVLRIHPDLAVAAEDQGAQVAGNGVVHAAQLDHAVDDVITSEVGVHPIDLGGIDEPLRVLLRAEDAGTLPCLVATHALENHGTVIHDGRHDVDLGVVPGNELAVMPDLFGRNQRHVAPSDTRTVFVDMGCCRLGRQNIIGFLPPISTVYWMCTERIANKQKIPTLASGHLTQIRNCDRHKRRGYAVTAVAEGDGTSFRLNARRSMNRLTDICTRTEATDRYHMYSMRNPGRSDHK